MGVGSFLLREIEGRFNVSLISRDDLSLMQSRWGDAQSILAEAEDLAYHSLDYFSGKPQDLRPEERRRLAQRSRIAQMIDPLAGAEGDLKSNFALGRGVPAPEAPDESVQAVLEEAWTDPVNQEALTSTEAQHHRSRELLAQANLFPTAYIRNGRVRIAFTDADIVTHVVCDPDNDERPLYYVTRKRTVGWDMELDRPKTVDEMRNDLGMPKVIYHQHWRNVEDYRAEVTQDAADGGKNAPAGSASEVIPEPPEEKRGGGLVHHVRINRIGRTQFGTPPFARSLRWMSAMNELTEAHVSMAQARSTFFAKRVRQGNTPSQILKASNSILAQTGEIGAARFGEQDAWGHGGPPPAPGSIWMENQADTLEALNFSSGAAEAMQTAQIVRAPVAAAAGFQQGYLGDAQNAGSLASATALELPTLMNVQAWQETLEGMLRWFCDLVLREAVRAGRLSDDPTKATMAKTLAELNLQEADQKAEAERRTGKKLNYSIAMPYPGRRALPEVVTAVTQPLTAIPNAGRNESMVRRMLLFLYTHGFQLDDPKQAVEEDMDEMTKVWAEADRQQMEQTAFSNQLQMMTAAAKPGAPGAAPKSGQPGTETGSVSGEGRTSSGGAMSEAELGLLFDRTLAPALAGAGAALNGTG